MNWLNYFRPYPELKTVIVNLKSGRSFRGVIWRRKHGEFMVLKNAIILGGEGSRPVDNELLIPVADIEFIQVI